MDNRYAGCYDMVIRKTGVISMELLEQIKKNFPLDEPEDMDTLLEFADLVRSALEKRQFEDLGVLVRYTVSNGYHEALYWTLGIVQEHRDCMAGEPEIVCTIGRLIPDYSAFISRLGVNLNAFSNDVEPIRDENGEIQSFYNIIRYETCFSHIALVTSENFDAKDNDFIEYRLIIR